MDLKLNGLKALVTGGTRGIGLAIAQAFVAEGADVALCSRDRAAVERTVADLTRRAAGAVRVTGAAVDVADRDALQAWTRSVAEQFDGLDIVVANVSALSIADEVDAWKAEFETDMMGTVNLVHAAMPYLEASQAASIVGIASVSAREIDFAAGPYGTFKAAVVHYLQGLAYQLAPKGIRANTVSPGNTYFAGGIWENIERNNPKLFADSLALNPTGRMARPEEIANAVVFIASPTASFVSGTNLVVDGALTRGVQF
ncbi:SDR family NAD(P)-dependent oxidoreductase [Paraburkholderia humisilvae]|uniref:3alpha-hydroxy bile acid-CoA-ester 3-dehydrogenase 1/3 n=1 Tax=Paraburkholderia humisilvae TaxID=627669 RepID=A0A6J5E720_9BURK|nr:SDR family oxidoreductase [Paraburkholderia humisilvae]CAB3761384.1 3alpha-hydroxy bile acid-CoA-ester 3-dehydrogenase 1/3 [Paraburkholderia humisilvae]